MPRVYRQPSDEPRRKFAGMLPVQLLDRLRERAQRNRRAVVSELILILEQHFAAEDTAAKVTEQQTVKVA